ncbi:MAG TPA: amidohydrolase, partial [Candidatus Altiarchaeales archaeon]|nr:amidohydrolase [Candidatus Altiarchaeales archaeon]
MTALIKNVQLEGKITNIYIEGNIIQEIGSSIEADYIIDGEGKVALPGFVNT